MSINCLERNGPIIRYLVSYTGLQDEIMREENVSDLSFTAIGLLPRACYDFTVVGFVNNITEPSLPATVVANTSVPQGRNF